VCWANIILLILQFRRLNFIFHYFARAPWINLRFQQGREWPWSPTYPYLDINIIIIISSINLGTSTFWNSTEFIDFFYQYNLKSKDYTNEWTLLTLHMFLKLFSKLPVCIISFKNIEHVVPTWQTFSIKGGYIHFKQY